MANTAATDRPRPGASGESHPRTLLGLQGLRGIAVLLVVFNHARVSFLGGGYVGVDVFFVLSGYFITTLLLREAFGSLADRPRLPISLTRFYGRRARRILPAAVLTIVLMSIAVYIVYGHVRHDEPSAKTTLMDALSATLFYANLHFQAAATNYFAQGAGGFPSPFQHFWSLSVEEQFYVVWPSLLLIVFLFARKLSPPVTRRASTPDDHSGAARDGLGLASRVAAVLTAAVILVGFGLSLWWSVHLTKANMQSAYFSTFARVWELALGAGVALSAPRLRGIPRRVWDLAGVAGLAMVFVAAVAFSSSTAFPGSAALLPTFGAALIIMASACAASSSSGGASGSAGASRSDLAARVLSVRPLTYVGDRSYTFYLWHFPALMLADEWAGHQLSVLANLVVLLCAFAISAVTFRFYENPLRFSRRLRGWRTAAMIPISLGVGVLAAMVPVLVIDGTEASQAAALAHARVPALTPAPGHRAPTNLEDPTPIPAVVRAVSAVRANARVPKLVVPTLAQDEAENHGRDPGGGPTDCGPKFGTGITSKVCRLGDQSSKRTLAILGDSHAGMWFPALNAVAKRLHIGLVMLAKPGCRLYSTFVNTTRWPCLSWRLWATAQIKRLHPVATLVTFYVGQSRPKNMKFYARTMGRVLKSLPNGVLLADAPRQSVLPAACLGSGTDRLGRCFTREPSWYPQLLGDLASMVKKDRFGALPTLQWLCADRICPVLINHTLTTHDLDGHLTPEYDSELAPVLEDELKPVLKAIADRKLR